MNESHKYNVEKKKPDIRVHTVRFHSYNVYTSAKLIYAIWNQDARHLRVVDSKCLWKMLVIFLCKCSILFLDLGVTLGEVRQGTPECATLAIGLFWTEDNQVPANWERDFYFLLNCLKEFVERNCTRKWTITRDNLYIQRLSCMAWQTADYQTAFLIFLEIVFLPFEAPGSYLFP